MKTRGNQPRKGRLGSPTGSRSARPEGPSAGSAEHSGVVGIGSSAGGLAALFRFFDAMPPDSGLAFVLVPHLDPKHESLMVEIIRKHTRMVVREVADGAEVEANTVSIVPPNRYVSIAGRALALKPMEPDGPRTPIDLFLRSLADDQGASSFAIILSGTGSHGTVGARDIKLAGGVVFVQGPESAEFDQMPRSAIAAGVADQVLVPEDMPRALVAHVARQGSSSGEPEDGVEAVFGRVLAILRQRTKSDFRGYRRPMVVRRIRRRMALQHCDTADAYVGYLEKHPGELSALRKDLMIGITGFFREGGAFDVLEQRIVPALVERALEENLPIRVWIPGCATGEEAFSVGMLLLEGLSARGASATLQIFATDIDEESLAIARHAIYPEGIAVDVSPERRRRFFRKLDSSHYQVLPVLRDAVVFAPQNLINDAPFSKLDLITCRNLLIYLEADVQAKVLSLFHFALNVGGYLLLGPSESVGDKSELFRPISRRHRVYERSEQRLREIVEIPVLPVPRALPTVGSEVPFKAHTSLLDVMYRRLVEELAPAAVLIDKRDTVMAFLGPVNDFLEFPAGLPTTDLLALSRPGLRGRIQSVCRLARRERSKVVDDEARVTRADRIVPCAITVRPIAGVGEFEDTLLVSFRDLPPPPADKEGTPGGGTGEEALLKERRIVERLEHELVDTRSDLRSSIAELESSNEELKASNEEVMSMNEELQSANEELEISKEEVQSLNEELSTVNQQLQDKVTELDTANRDISDLLDGIDVGIVLLDAQLRVRRFTQPMVALLNLLPTDVGRPLQDLAPRFTHDTLYDDCRTVLTSGGMIEKEVQTLGDGRAYLERILQFSTTGPGSSAGVILVLIDIALIKGSSSPGQHLASVLHDSDDAVTVLDPDGNITAWSQGATHMYGYEETEAVEMDLFRLVPSDEHAQARASLEGAVRGERAVAIEARRVSKTGSVLDVSLTLTPLRDAAGRIVAVAAVERDLTERKQREKALAASVERIEGRMRNLTLAMKLRERRLQTLADEVPVMFAYVDKQGHCRYANRRFAELFVRSAESITGQSLRNVVGRSDHRKLKPYLDRAFAGRAQRFEWVAPGPERRRTLDVRLVPDRPESGEMQGAMFLGVDVTDARAREQELQENRDRLQSILETVAEAIITTDAKGTILAINPAAVGMLGWSEREAIGMNIREVFVPEDRVRHDARRRAPRRTGAPYIGGLYTLEGVRKDGTRFPVELSVSRRRHLGLFTGVARDISARREVERTQIAHREELAQVVRMGTAGELASGIAHELSQPLASIGNDLAACLSHLRAGRPTRTKLMDLLGEAVGELDRAGLILDSLRELARGSEPRRQRVDLRIPIEGMKTVLAGDLEQHQVHLELNGMDNVAEVKGDPVQIEQVLHNLVRNAIDSLLERRPKAPRIDVELAPVRNGFAEISVRDNGRGVSKANAGRLFDPFFTTKAGNLGIGLALCHSIVDAHGGRLWLEGADGRRRGATFRFTLESHTGRGRSPSARVESVAKSRTRRKV